MRPDRAEQLERLLQSSRHLQQRLTDADARVRQASARAASRDNLVTATVTADAGLTELTISPRAMRRYDSGTLAATILAVVTDASDRLRAIIAEYYRELLGDDLDPAALAGDPDGTAEAIAQLARRLRE